MKLTQKKPYTVRTDLNLLKKNYSDILPQINSWASLLERCDCFYVSRKDYFTRLGFLQKNLLETFDSSKSSNKYRIL
jgi:hypothetical protein